MNAPHPILPDGAESEQSIWEVTRTARVPVGTRGWLPDGRAFRYARNSGAAALVAGNMVQAELTSADMVDCATDDTASGVGSPIIEVTPTGTKTHAAGDLAGGYAMTNSGTAGAGINYEIASNPATTAATEFVVTLKHPIAVAFNADTTVTVIKNPWMDPVIAATGVAHFMAGVPNIAVGAGNTTAQHYWCQTWGAAAVATDLVELVGRNNQSGSTTAGQIEVTTSPNSQFAGIGLAFGAADDFNPIFLTIAP